MAEVLAVGFLKNELLKAAARRREQAKKTASPRLIAREVEIKPSRPDKQNGPA